MYATVLGSMSMQLHTETKENIPPNTVMNFLDSLRAHSYTNQPLALADIKYDIVNIINFRVNKNKCQTTGRVASEYLAVHQTGMLSCRMMKPDKL
jgi:hypothetical protein